METLIVPAIHLLALVSFLVWKLRKPLVEFVATRHNTVAAELKQSQTLLNDAKERFEQFSAKLKAVEVEVGALRGDSKNDAEKMKEQIQIRAKKLAEGIRADSQTTAQGLVGELKGQLYSELGASVLRRAEEIIRTKMTTEDRARIRQDFARQIVEAGR